MTGAVRRPLLVLASVVLVALLVVVQHPSLAVDSQLAAGALTVFNRTSAAFEKPASNLTPEEIARHDVGDPLFERSHIPLATHQDAGLGPLFNANSCVACHVRNGRGAPVPGVSLVRVALQEAGGTTPVPDWEWQVQDHAIFGHQPEATMDLTWHEEPQASDEPPLQKVHVGLIRPNGEAVADSEMNRSLRTAPPLIGLGLLEAVPDQAILSHADPDDQDGDGISGRAVVLRDEHGQQTLGRFGWKAGTATVQEQTAEAYLNDMGLTTAADPETNRTAEGQPADITQDELTAVTFYSQSLGAPAAKRRGQDPLVSKGSALFGDLHCATCHVPSHETSTDPNAVVAAIRSQTIWPYTDLLVHDMGSGLDDGVAEHGYTSSAEWRTAPLWGLGLTHRVNGKAGYLHDGRARTVDEAIRWHGGEAEGAKENYLALAPRDRQSLLDWLQGL
ncbi:MAG: thiol oxidoreductase [Synechococcus sp. SB0668_bin_15]|nr:thiol oxidoreductase [Synechococcus sp. SB0668_bin_15]MYC50554.1 thiol oxidoreductase [Synechococcus sp. SB0662_bin_14]